MWLKLDLDGTMLYLTIRGYKKSADCWDEKWCSVEFTVQSGLWLNYTQAGELLLACEVSEILSSFEKLVQGMIHETEELEFLEPDLNIILYPQRDLREDPKYVYVKQGGEIVDISAEFRISFWNGGLTSNYLSLGMDRGEIQSFLIYLKLVAGQISRSDAIVQEMLQAGTLLEYV